MQAYDVIIIGAGPAGLKCAEVLGGTGMRVLLLEKKDVPGDKLCAGGLTLKGLEVLPLPDSVVEHRISRAILHSRNRRAVTDTPYHFLFTINRKELAAWQKSLLDGSGVLIQMNSQVTAIHDDRVVLKDGREYAYRFLVGAEGYSSPVRKHLQLPVKRKLIGFQYTLPRPGVAPELEIYLDSRYFHSWYAWIFPHRDSIAVGCCCDPDRVDHMKVRQNFHNWLKYKNIETGGAILESCPISYDYRGIQFGNVFLAGEAAGLPSGLTGEGIYQSLVSGQEVARMIQDPAYISAPMKQVLRYNRTLHRILLTLRVAGPFQAIIHELFVYLMNRKGVRDRVNSAFS